MNDATIDLQRNCLSISEPTQNAVIGSEQKFFDSMKKLEAHDVDLTGPWLWLCEEAEVSTSSLAQSDSFCSHGHATGT